MIFSIYSLARARRRIWRENFQERAEYQVLSEIIDNNKIQCAFDVGANVGIFTLLFRKKCKRVVAFEANPLLAKKLTRAFALTRGVKIIDSAVSSERKTGDFFVSTNHGISSTKPISKYIKKIKLKYVTIDDFIMLCPEMLKIDVEGAEVDVLRGSLRTLKFCDPVVMLEVNPLTYEECISILRAAGYEKFRYFSSGGEFKIDHHKPSNSFNVICEKI